MVTINLDPLRGGGTMPRASVNGLQFVEAEPLRGGGVLNDAPILSSKDVHSIIEWTPEDASEGNEIGGPVTVNFEAVAGELLDLDFTDTESFDDDGTHDGTVSVATAIILAASSPETDFEDYVGGLITSGSQPESWTNLSPYDNMRLSVDIDPPNQSVKALYWNEDLVVQYDPAGVVSGGEMKVRFRFNDSTGRFLFYHLITGSGSAMRGHYVQFERNSVNMFYGRCNSYDNRDEIRFESFGFPLLEDKWYWGKIQFVHDPGVRVYAQYKIWADGDTEPASYSWGGEDTAYMNDGTIAVATWHSSANQVYYWDDISFVPPSPVYGTSGNWESDPLDVSAAEIAAGHRITFDATTPPDTTAIVKCKWGVGDSWLTCADGEKLPGLLYRENMLTGSARAIIYLRIELATTDTSATPEIDNFVISFDPCIFADVELLVDSKSATIANGHLAKWGREQISGGVLIEAFDDLTVQGWGFESYRLNGESVPSVLKYDGYTIGEVIFSQLLQTFKVGAADGYFAFRGGSIEAVAVAQFTARTTWSIAFHDYQWTLIDKTQGIHADAWFWVGHAQADDFPGSMIAAELQLSDHLGSIIAEGYKRDDFLGSELIQGYRFDDTIGSILPGLEKLNDFLGMQVVAIGHRTDFPGALLVYGVNRRNELEIQTVDADTVVELEKLGFVFPPEAT